MVVTLAQNCVLCSGGAGQCGQIARGLEKGRRVLEGEGKGQNGLALLPVTLHKLQPIKSISRLISLSLPSATQQTNTI